MGDALGAPFEGGPLERGLWRVIGRTRDGRLRWTDDTQMSLDLCESLLSSGSIVEDDIARRFAQGYRWSRGYGPGAARVLKLIRRGVDWREANTRVFREGSFGNGGAMRAPVIGLFYASQLDAIPQCARRSASITHAHPLGQEGAVLVALATALALSDATPEELLARLEAHARHEPMRQRLSLAAAWISGQHPPHEEVRTQLGNGIAAAESCVTAIYVALRFIDDPFMDMLAFIAACRGDVDTIGAMAGAIWGARNGEASLPARELARVEATERVARLARELHEAATGRVS